jgi:hypothetical protein
MNMNAKFAKSILASLLGFGMLTFSGPAVAQYGPPPASQYGDRGWDAPPQELRDFQRRGYVDGVQGAQRDFENHRIWNVNNRDEFRHPHVPGNVRGDYREGFKRGYYVTVHHFQDGRGSYPR